MKRYSFLMFLLFCACGFVSAQLTNSGATITIQPGATLVVTGDIVNEASGTIVNDGIIEFTGNVTNDGTMTSGSGSTLKANGSTNSAVDLNGAALAIFENNKTAGDVTLSSPVTVNEQMNFAGSSDVVLGDYDLTLGETATSNGSATGHFVTDGMGKLNKVVTAAGTYTADVGDGTNYTPIEYAHSGTYSNSVIGTTVTGMKHPDISGDVANADSYINRYWVMSTDITSPSISMTGTYVAGDVQGTEANMKGARWENTEWEFETGAQAASTISASTTETNSELTGMNYYAKANVTAFLEGPYSGSGMMSTALNGNLPTTNPYDATETGISVPANAVDYVLVEIREAGSLNTVAASKSGFLLSDGSIVSTTGGALYLKDATANSHITVKHRNSLGILSASPIPNIATSAVTVNMGDGSTSLYTAGPSAAKDLGDGNFGLYSGDGDGNGDINFDDFLNVWFPNNSAPWVYNGSGVADYDMNGDINFDDFLNIWFANNSIITQIPQ